MSQNLIDRVTDEPAFETRTEAKRLTRATLRVFGQRISTGEAKDIAAELSREPADALLDADTGRSISMSVEEFIAEVQTEAGIERDVESEVRAVFDALREIAGDEVDDARSELPEEYNRILGPGARVTQSLETAVIERTELDSEGQARKTIQATLTVLGQRIQRGEAKKLAAELPGGFGTELVQAEPEEAADFDSDEFVSRVAQRAGVTESQARELIQSISEVIAQRTSRKELHDIRVELPPGYRTILGPIFREGTVGE